MTDEIDVRALTGEALDDLGRSDRLGSVLEKAIRIAELRRDVYNLWWLRLEAIGYRNERARAQWNLKIADQIPEQMRDSLLTGIVRDSQERREYIAFDETTGERKKAVSTWSVAETDALIDEREAHVATPPPPADSPEAYAFWMTTRLEATVALTQWKRVRARQRQRVHRFLVEVESTILFGETALNAFERTRRFVDGELATIAPAVLAQFQSAYERTESGDPEALTHALTSCRRILVALADVLYPATGETLVGADGRPREMTAEKYRNRLWQFVYENSPHENSRKLVLATVEEIGRRLDTLNDLASKGVHADVTSAEADQCVLQVYLLAGDLLRLRSVPLPTR